MTEEYFIKRRKNSILNDLCCKLNGLECDIKVGKFKLIFSKFYHEGTGNNIDRYSIHYKNKHVGYLCIEDRIETYGDCAFHIFDLNKYKVFPYDYDDPDSLEIFELLVELNSLL